MAVSGPDVRRGRRALWVLLVAWTWLVVCWDVWTLAAALSEVADGGARSWDRDGDGLRVAVVLYGDSFHLLDVTGPSILRHVVRPLRADVFASGDKAHDAARVFGRHFRRVARGVLFERPLFPSQLHNLWQVMAPRSPNFVHKLGADGKLEASVPFGTMPSREEALHFRSLPLGYELVTSHEMWRGFRYDVVLFMEPAFEWLAPHPPLDLLARKARVQGVDALWFADRAPWSGVPLGYVGAPRALAETVARKHRNQEALATHWRQAQPCTHSKRGNCTEQRALKVYLHAMQVPAFGYFSSVMARVCVPRCVDNRATTLCCSDGNGAAPRCAAHLLCPPESARHLESTSSAFYDAQIAQRNADAILARGWRDDDLSVERAASTETPEHPRACWSSKVPAQCVRALANV